MPLLRTLLVDDDDIVRKVLEMCVARQDRLIIVGSVATGEEAIIAAERLRPGLVILDLCLPGLSGIDTMRSIFKSLPHVRIIVLSALQTPHRVHQAFDAGATGYVYKPSSSTDLPEALLAVTSGRQYISPVLRDSTIGTGNAQFS